MTSIDPTIVSAENGARAVGTTAETFWERSERWLSRASDRLNPILVKESRQALRSRQFTTTFFLLLAAGWTWSIMGLALLGPSAYYNATGPQMFYVYYLILAAPLLVVIPYVAYSSLASERQDRTYELVSITALDASGILLGKLAGISMQMLVYLSALLPCLAFTYLLRGLDIFSVLLVVLYTCLLSLGLALSGLLLATLSPPRQRYVIIGVIFAVWLFYVFGMTVTMLSALVASEGLLLADPYFWIVNLSLLLLYVNVVAILFLAARSQLMAVSQNRSTALRIATTVAQLSAIGWTAWAAMAIDDSLVYALILLSFLFWFVAGLVIAGESDQLSPRVRRGLPKSLPGRLLFSWYVPGSGTGYTFVIMQMLLLCVVVPLMTSDWATELMLQLTGTARSIRPRNMPNPVRAACVVATCYIVIYVGLTRLILSAVRRYEEIRLSLRILVGVLLVMFLGGGPWVIQITNPQTRNLDYTIWQALNPMWTMGEYCLDNGPPNAAGEVLLIFLPVVAVAVWLANLPSVARQLREHPVPVPARVVEEDREIATAAIQRVGPTNPWSEEAG